MKWEPMVKKSTSTELRANRQRDNMCYMDITNWTFNQRRVITGGLNPQRRNPQPISNSRHHGQQYYSTKTFVLLLPTPSLRPCLLMNGYNSLTICTSEGQKLSFPLDVLFNKNNSLNQALFSSFLLLPLLLQRGTSTDLISSRRNFNFFP